MIGAFLYLTVRSISNGVRLRLRRLRQPRYLIIGLGLVLYVGSMLWSRPPSGVIVVPAAYRQYADVAAVVLATMLLGAAWVLPNGLALAFSSAEVQLLFPAPITRRQLIGYKIWRLLLGTAATTAAVTLFVAPPRLLPAAAFAGRTFVVLAIMALYQTGVALHRKQTEEGFRIHAPRRIATAVLAIVLTPAIGWVLARVALGPAAELAYVLPFAAVWLVGCGLWVLQSDAAFEEAAAEAAEQVRLAVKGGYRIRPGRRANRSSRFRLAERGPIETALLWKNWMLVARPSRAAVVTIAVLLASLLVGVLISVDAAAGRSLFGILSFVVAAVLVLFGPAMLRVDLRQDLAHLAIIKTWPVRGAAVFRGELLAPLIALSLAAALPILLWSALDDKMILAASSSAALRAAVAGAALLVASALLLAQLVIQNGIAVTFPAWVSLTPAAGIGGVERMGQMMVVLYGGMFALIVASIVPAGAAAAAWFLVGGSWTAPLIAGVVFSGLLVVECLAASELFGRILERTDLQDLAINE